MSEVAPRIEYGVASFVKPGNSNSGDLAVVQFYDGGALLSVIDGVGHGDEAFIAAQCAKTTIDAHPREPVEVLMQRCHAALRPTRGAVMSLAAIDLQRGLLLWLGVGNVQGIVCRSNSNAAPAREELLLRSGVVGAQLPALRSAAIPICRGDTLIFTTDGIRSNFANGLTASAPPHLLAQNILAQHLQGSDDALVLVARIV